MITAPEAVSYHSLSPDPTERSEVRSGSVFIWEKRSSMVLRLVGCRISVSPSHLPPFGNVCGIERWTEGLKWGPSCVRDVSLLDLGRTHAHKVTSHRPASCLVIRYRWLLNANSALTHC